MDLTLVLKRLLELGWRETLVAVIVDAAAWEMCSKAGEGGRVGLGLGRFDPTSASGDSQLLHKPELVQLLNDKFKDLIPERRMRTFT